MCTQICMYTYCDIHVYIYAYTYIHIYICATLTPSLSLFLSLCVSLPLSLYIYVHMHISIYIYIYIYWRSNLTKQKYPRLLHQQHVVRPSVLLRVRVLVLGNAQQVLGGGVLFVRSPCSRMPRGEHASCWTPAREGRTQPGRCSSGVVVPRTRASTCSSSAGLPRASCRTVGKSPQRCCTCLCLRLCRTLCAMLSAASLFVAVSNVCCFVVLEPKLMYKNIYANSKDN